MPFVPFLVLLPNGEKFRVPRADYIWVHSDRRTVFIVVDNGETRLFSEQALTQSQVS